jgi:hypothetical protein
MVESGKEGSSPTDSFSLVGNEIRAEIVRALGDARVENRTPPTLSFSELRSRAGVEVGSSKFNYHLKQLVGHYVQQVEDGYEMRPEGRILYQTIRARTLDRRSDPDDRPTGMDCYFCETAVEATFTDGVVRVECPGCEYMYDMIGVPPGPADAPTDEEPLLERVSAYNHDMHLSFARGICPYCGSKPGIEFLTPSTIPFSGSDRRAVYVYRGCDHCGSQMHLSIGEALLADPGLVAFCHEHGVDVFETPLWELEFAATDRGVTVRSTDPWEIEIAVTYDEETLELVVNEQLEVVSRSRP